MSSSLLSSSSSSLLLRASKIPTCLPLSITVVPIADVTFSTFTFVFCIRLAPSSIFREVTHIFRSTGPILMRNIFPLRKWAELIFTHHKCTSRIRYMIRPRSDVVYGIYRGLPSVVLGLNQPRRRW